MRSPNLFSGSIQICFLLCGIFLFHHVASGSNLDGHVISELSDRSIHWDYSSPSHLFSQVDSLLKAHFDIEFVNSFNDWLHSSIYFHIKSLLDGSDFDLNDYCSTYPVLSPQQFCSDYISISKAISFNISKITLISTSFIEESKQLKESQEITNQKDPSQYKQEKTNSPSITEELDDGDHILDLLVDVDLIAPFSDEFDDESSLSDAPSLEDSIENTEEESLETESDTFESIGPRVQLSFSEISNISHFLDNYLSGIKLYLLSNQLLFSNTVGNKAWDDLVPLPTNPNISLSPHNAQQLAILFSLESTMLGNHLGSLQLGLAFQYGDSLIKGFPRNFSAAAKLFTISSHLHSTCSEFFSYIESKFSESPDFEFSIPWILGVLTENIVQLEIVQHEQLSQLLDLNHKMLSTIDFILEYDPSMLFQLEPNHALRALGYMHTFGHGLSQQPFLSNLLYLFSSHESDTSSQFVSAHRSEFGLFGHRVNCSHAASLYFDIATNLILTHSSEVPWEMPPPLSSMIVRSGRDEPSFGLQNLVKEFHSKRLTSTHSSVDILFGKKLPFGLGSLNFPTMSSFLDSIQSLDDNLFDLDDSSFHEPDEITNLSESTLDAIFPGFADESQLPLKYWLYGVGYASGSKIESAQFPKNIPKAYDYFLKSSGFASRILIPGKPIVLYDPNGAPTVPGAVLKSMVAIANIHYWEDDFKDYSMCLNWLKRAASYRLPDAHKFLGLAHLNGKLGLKQSEADAISQFTYCAASDPQCKAYLGYLYFTGHIDDKTNVPIGPNYKNAFTLLTQASEADSMFAKYLLGLMYYHGFGIPATQNSIAQPVSQESLRNIYTDFQKANIPVDIIYSRDDESESSGDDSESSGDDSESSESTQQDSETSSKFTYKFYHTKLSGLFPKCNIGLAFLKQVATRSPYFSAPIQTIPYLLSHGQHSTALLRYLKASDYGRSDSLKSSGVLLEANVGSEIFSENDTSILWNSDIDSFTENNFISSNIDFPTKEQESETSEHSIPSSIVIDNLPTQLSFSFLKTLAHNPLHWAKFFQDYFEFSDLDIPYSDRKSNPVWYRDNVPNMARLSFLYLDQSAELTNNIHALLSLANSHFLGIGTPQNYELAFLTYQRALQLAPRNSLVNYNLAYMYHHGFGTSQDVHLAKRHYDLAIENNVHGQLGVYIALFRLSTDFCVSELKKVFSDPKWTFSDLFSALHNIYDTIKINLTSAYNAAKSAKSITSHDQHSSSDTTIPESSDFELDDDSAFLSLSVKFSLYAILMGIIWVLYRGRRRIVREMEGQEANALNPNPEGIRAVGVPEGPDPNAPIAI